MSDSVFFDTNILVYCYTDTEPVKRDVAIKIAQSPDVWISTQVLQELSNILRKKFNKEWDEIAQTLHEICQNFKVYTNQPNTINDALRLANKYGYSFYDSLILSSSISIGCSIVFSEDMQNGQAIDGSLKITNPFL